jgi:hypothetical protein
LFFKKKFLFLMQDNKTLTGSKKKDLFFFVPAKYLFFLNRLFFMGVLLIFINPRQVPLPEPYFDLTLIKVMHTKIAY